MTLLTRQYPVPEFLKSYWHSGMIPIALPGELNTEELEHTATLALRRMSKLWNSVKHL